MAKAYLQQYVDYIKNAIGAVKFPHFVEDWEPIGEMVLKALLVAGMLVIKDNLICLPEEK